MKKLSIFLSCIALWMLSAAAHAEWVSALEKKYEQRSPAAYANVREARRLIADSRGRPAGLRQAADLLEGVLRDDPKFAPAYVQMASVVIDQSHYGKNRFDRSGLLQAGEWLARALRLEPDYDYALAITAYTKTFLGEFDEAERIYRRLLDAGSTYPYLHTQYAQLASQRGDAATALRRGQQAFERNKGDPQLAVAAITEILFAYEKLPGDTSAEEEVWYARRVAIDPHPWHWQAHASFRLYRLGDYENSIRYGTKALSLMDFGMARFTLAGAYYHKWFVLKSAAGREAEAKDAFRRAEALGQDRAALAQWMLTSRPLKATGEELQQLPK
jgi:tetratricopeptide (TPR) repeat protein